MEAVAASVVGTVVVALLILVYFKGYETGRKEEETGQRRRETLAGILASGVVQDSGGDALRTQAVLLGLNGR